MKKFSLNGKWNGECVDKFTFLGEVPGSSIYDLIQAGKLPENLLSDKNADEVLKYETCDFNYKKSFNIEEIADKATLVFERLDTFADVYFNDKFIGHRENGNIEHKFDISSLIIKGENTVEVKFKSWVNAAKPVSDDVPFAFTKERVNIRRMQCTFSWDWVARFVGCSIGNTFILLAKKDEIIVDNIHVYTKNIDKYSAAIGLDINFEPGFKGRIVDFEIVAPNGQSIIKKERYCDAQNYRFNFDIVSPELWYPLGYGKQPLYEVIIKDNDKIIFREKFGIRTIKVLQIEDTVDSLNYNKCLEIKHPYYDNNKTFSSFILLVNGVKVFCKGGNWVPSQPYLMPNREEKIIETLSLAKEMGVNMIRVWGGGAFECKTFYDECSRLGILVTQDFLMACALYPEKEEWFINELLKETEYAVKLIRNQPCLAWWSGDNENAVEGSDVQSDYRGRDSFYKGIEPILSKFDPYREAFASSPYGGDFYASNTVGTTHHTQYMSRFFSYVTENDSLADYKEELKRYRARFVAEEPIFGAISPSSIKKFMTEDDIYSGDLSMWLYHTKGNPAMKRELCEYFYDFAEKTLGEFKNPHDRFFKFRYIEYEWVRVVLEQARREKWFCSGMIFWMLNECWTAAAGWSLVDYYNKLKMGAYSFKRSAKPIILSIDYDENQYKLSVINDGNINANCKVTLYKISKNNVSVIKDFSISSIANENVTIELDIYLNDNEILVAELISNLNNDRTFYKSGDLKIMKINDAIEYQVDKIKKVVTIKAKKYVHVVELDGDMIFEDNGFSLLAGESRKIPYRLIKEFDSDEITIETYNLEIFA